ncbi:MAG: hypothetical protein JXC33_08450 [Deltaproteobacteria bacterium]|nr:hypothetical protein [Deltaproteobacteria bacterium]
MTISPYQVESVLKAYNKQSETRKSVPQSNDKPVVYTDVVTLSSENNKEEAFEKISYGLLEIILQNKKPE